MTRVKRMTGLRISCAAVAVAALVLVLGCRGGDTERMGCAEGESSECMCPNGASGQRFCARGNFSECMCAAMPVMDASMPADFGNTDGAAPPVLPDARVIENPDAQIMVDTTCGEQESQAVIDEERPVDVIFIIDNSGSMGEEIEAVERNINQNFAQIIEASGADYRVIMLTDHGADTWDVCVAPPLAAEPCDVSTAPAGPTLGAPANGERFYHYDINVQSYDSVCLMLQHYQVDPMLGPLPETGATAAPTGWNEWLRADALKVFVEITDDRLSCNAVATNPDWDFTGLGDSLTEATRLSRKVHAAILGLSGDQFGTPEEPRFIWHSLVGVAENDPIDLPYTHFDPPLLGTTQCTTAVNVGSAYQMLSIATAGLRYPVCAADSGHGYDSVFRAIAHEVVRGSRVDCAFNIPTPPPGKFVDYGSVVVEYTPGDGGEAQRFGRVLAGDCDDHSFYFEDREIKLCTPACDRVRADESAKINVVFGCGPEKPLDPDIPIE